MRLETSTIETIQESAAVIIAKEFAKWINSEPVERCIQKAFNDIYQETRTQATVIIVAMKIFMGDYQEVPQSKIEIEVNH